MIFFFKQKFMSLASPGRRVGLEGGHDYSILHANPWRENGF